VVLMHGDNMSYAESFDEALEGLLDQAPAADRAITTATTPGGLRETLARAQAAFEDYLEAHGEGRFEDAAEALGRLQSALSRGGGDDAIPAGTRP